MSTKIKHDLTGLKFGSLTAVKLHHQDSKGNAFWEYKCQCGNTHIARANTVTYQSKQYKNKNPSVPSCGCANLKAVTKHGYRKKDNTHSAYRAYRGIMSRCYNLNDAEYKWYGAVGVTICDEWKNNPKAFIEWSLNNGWNKGLHIDKDIICNQLNIKPHIYSPDTCLWVTPQRNVSEATNRKNYGKHPNIKLSQTQVDEILHLYFSEQITNCNKLAKMFGVKSSSTIYRLIKIEKEKRANTNDIS